MCLEILPPVGLLPALCGLFYFWNLLMPNSISSYEDGIREGQIRAIEQMQAAHAIRLEKVEGRVSTLERVAYTLIGAIALIQFAPSLKGFL